MVKLELDQYPAAHYSAFLSRPQDQHRHCTYNQWIQEQFGAEYLSIKRPDDFYIIEYLVFKDEGRAVEFVLKHG